MFPISAILQFSMLNSTSADKPSLPPCVRGHMQLCSRMLLAGRDAARVHVARTTRAPWVRGQLTALGGSRACSLVY